MNRRVVNDASLDVRAAATVLMNSLIRPVLERLPRKSKWVFAKPNTEPYTAVRGFRAACQEAGFIAVYVTPHVRDAG